MKDVFVSTAIAASRSKQKSMHGCISQQHQRDVSEVKSGNQSNENPTGILRQPLPQTNPSPTLLIAVRAGSQAASRSCTNSCMLLEITLKKKKAGVSE